MPFIFLLLWILFNMKLNLEILLTGIAVSFAGCWFCRRHMGYAQETDKKILRKLFRGCAYIGVLIWKTAEANFKVAKLVFAKHTEVEPQIIFFRTNLQTEAARVVLAHSINLTPGTITVALNDDLICVHCLNSQMAEGINDSVFVRQLRKLEGTEGSRENGLAAQRGSALWK